MKITPTRAIAALLFLSALSMSPSAQAQVSISVNIGTQPQWGPVGYEHVDYYYMPDIDAYYYVPRHQYIYLDGGRWIFAAALPPRFASYDVYRGYKVVVNEPRPYLHPQIYRERYARYRNCYGQQVVIRDHRHVDGDRYDHPGKRGRGHAYGHYKHHD
ncbi:MAG TPA: hypothetical protein VI233_16275 [Puia sp.]